MGTSSAWTKSARVLGACAALAVVAACPLPEAPTSFGKACSDDDDCDAALLCFGGRCQGTDPDGILGETCANPFVETVPAGGLLIPVAVSAERRPDVDTPCFGALNDLVLALEVPEPMGLVIRARTAFGVAGVAAFADAACDVTSELPFACDILGSADETELVIPLVQERVFVVVASPGGGQGVDLLVERLPCPAGSVPFDLFGAGRCARFQPVASMNEPRAEATGTLLADGRVLVVGGANSVAGDGDLQVGASAEIYNPATNQWTTVLDPLARRAFHSAQRLDDNSVLIVGGVESGVSGNYLIVQESARFVGNAFVQGDDTAFSHAITKAVPVGEQVLVAGEGRSQLYDPATGTFLALGTGPADASSGTLVATATGAVFAGTNVVTDALDVYSAAGQSWSREPRLATPRAFSAVLQDGSDLLIAGGLTGAGENQELLQTVERLAPGSSRSTASPPLQKRRFASSAFVSLPGGFLVVGGAGGDMMSSEWANNSDVEWRAGPPLSQQQAFPVVVRLADGRVLVAGGYDLNREGLGQPVAHAHLLEPVEPQAP